MGKTFQKIESTTFSFMARSSSVLPPKTIAKNLVRLFPLRRVRNKAFATLKVKCTLIDAQNDWERT